MKANFTKVNLKSLSEKDVEQLIEIENLVSPYPWSKKLFYDSVSSSSTNAKGLFISDKLSGFIFYKQITDEITIENIAIHPDYQNTGYGTFMLYNSVLKPTNNSPHTIFLEVRSSNTPAIEFYKKHGFTKYSIRKNYYTNKNQSYEDAVLMKLLIKKKKKM